MVTAAGKVMIDLTPAAMMMSDMSEPDALAHQAKLMESYGAHCV